MDLELTRVDYGSIGTTLSNCVKLLPNEYKKQQKVAVGDLDGNLQLFSIKKSEAQIHFQAYVGKKVSCIQLGGASGTPLDKIFVATDNIVKAYNKKGKMFLSFDTNLTESIKCMFVSGADLITCGNHVYTHYRDCKDIGTYLCGDTIVDVVALCPNNTNRILTILACSGRVLRILEHCRVRQTIELDSVPTTLHVPKNIYGDRLICGFADGKVSIFYFGHFSGEVRQQVLIKPEVNPNAITCIDTYDMSGDGKDELLIGRRDGTVQVFALASDDDYEMEPRQLYRECFPESISGIQGGCVYSNGFVEIIVLSYAGSIFGLTTQVISVSLSDKHVVRETINRVLQNDIKKNRTQLQQFEQNQEKQHQNHQYQELTSQSSMSSSSAVLLTTTSSSQLQNSLNSTLLSSDDIITNEISQSESMENFKLSLVKPQENYRLSTQVVTSSLSSTSMLEINDSLTLNKLNASYHLFIELPIQILEITIKSEAAIEIINLENNENNNSKMMMTISSKDIENVNASVISPLNENHKFDLTNNYQFSAKTNDEISSNRFEMYFWTVEGQYGNLEAYITPTMKLGYSPMKTHFIRPLSLHVRIHSIDRTRPFNTLTLKGSFTQTDIHNWVEKCIPEVPERLSVDESNVLYFQNVLIETVLECKYGKGFAEFQSDNLSTISILKDFLTKEATKKRIKLEIISDINENSIPHVLKIIEPTILNCLKIKNDHKFLNALLQVNIQNDDDFNCLMPEYQSILKRRSEIENDFKKIAVKLSRFFGIVTDFYIDRFKFKGIFVKDKIPELIRILEEYNFDNLMLMFTEIKRNEINTQEI